MHFCQVISHIVNSLYTMIVIISSSIIPVINIKFWHFGEVFARMRFLQCFSSAQAAECRTNPYLNLSNVLTQIWGNKVEVWGECFMGFYGNHHCNRFSLNSTKAKETFILAIFFCISSEEDFSLPQLSQIAWSKFHLKFKYCLEPPANLLLLTRGLLCKLVNYSHHHQIHYNSTPSFELISTAISIQCL